MYCKCLAIASPMKEHNPEVTLDVPNFSRIVITSDQIQERVNPNALTELPPHVDWPNENQSGKKQELGSGEFKIMLQQNIDQKIWTTIKKPTLPHSYRSKISL